MATTLPRRGDHPWFHGLESVVAHQGGAGRDRGNQLAAYRTARAAGFDVIDVDVVGTVDGQLLVFHDRYLSRLTNGEGDVDARTAADIEHNVVYREPCRAPGSTSPRLDRFDEVLDEFADMRFNLEVKNDAALEPLVARLGSLGRDHLTRFNLSGTEHHCARLRERFPEAAHTLTKAELLRTLRSRRLPAGVDCGQLPIAIAPFDVDRRAWKRTALGWIKIGRPVLPVLMNRVAGAAHDAGAPVIYWTVDRLDDARWALDRGAVAVLSDRPVELRGELAA